MRVPPRSKGWRTRPTTDRAREGLFAWLGSRARGASVLDLFAGAGCLGIEALSRGASRATFVESSPSALSALRGNLQDLGLLERSRVLARDVRGALPCLRSEGGRFDLVLADPPYRRPAGPDWVAWLFREGEVESLVGESGVLVVERRTGALVHAECALVALRGSRSYGGTSFDWYEREGRMSE